jgi:hypothetical protein
MTFNPEHFYHVTGLAVALGIASAAPIFATEQSQAKHAGTLKRGMHYKDKSC